MMQNNFPSFVVAYATTSISARISIITVYIMIVVVVVLYSVLDMAFYQSQKREITIDLSMLHEAVGIGIDRYIMSIRLNISFSDIRVPI